MTTLERLQITAQAVQGADNEVAEGSDLVPVIQDKWGHVLPWTSSLR